MKFHPECQDKDDSTEHYDHTHGPGITGVGLSKVQAAHRTSGLQRQQQPLE